MVDVERKVAEKICVHLLGFAANSSARSRSGPVALRVGKDLMSFFSISFEEMGASNVVLWFGVRTCCTLLSSNWVSAWAGNVSVPFPSKEKVLAQKARD